jgi:hypothetical protein
MALPITINYTFGSSTAAIPLSNLDANFTTVVNAINGIGNGTNSLANVSITGGTVTATGLISASASGIRFSDGTTLTTASAITPSAAVGSFSNLKVNSSAGTANTAVTANEVVLENSTNSYFTVRSISVSISSGSVGVANGLDSGTVAANTWYSIWLIYNPTTLATAGLMSTSATAPTLPSGYTFKARVGWIRTSGTASQNLGIIQYGKRAQYIVDGTVLTKFPQIASGSTASGNWVAYAVSTFMPSTAFIMRAVVAGNPGSANFTSIGPNSNFTTTGASAYQNPPPIIAGYTSSQGGAIPGEITLESTNIYYASGTSSGAAYCMGWEDNL